MSWPELGARVTAGASAGLAIAMALLAADAALLGDPPPLLGILLLALGAFSGALIPVLAVRRAGERAHYVATRAVGTYLDLVVMCLAGGMGVESALQQAATIAEDPFSARIAAALSSSNHRGRPPWESLSELGDAVGVAELSELANVVSLAGTEGASIRNTLASKAEALRRRQLAEVESAANAMTERLFVPGALLLTGFLVFIGYPAMARIMSGL